MSDISSINEYFRFHCWKWFWWFSFPNFLYVRIFILFYYNANDMNNINSIDFKYKPNRICLMTIVNLDWWTNTITLLRQKKKHCFLFCIYFCFQFFLFISFCSCFCSQTPRSKVALELFLLICYVYFSYWHSTAKKIDEK